jgi:hypothetical protein
MHDSINKKLFYVYVCVKRALSSIKHSIHGQIGGQFPAYLLISHALYKNQFVFAFSSWISTQSIPNTYAEETPK